MVSVFEFYVIGMNIIRFEEIEVRFIYFEKWMCCLIFKGRVDCVRLWEGLCFSLWLLDFGLLKCKFKMV